MKSHLTPLHWMIIIAAVLFTVWLRVDSSFYNFTPIGGLALLGAAYLRPLWKAFVIPFMAWWATDLYLNNVTYAEYFDGFVWASEPFLFSVGALLLMVVFGQLMLRKITGPRLLASGLGAAVIFYLVSNFGVWLTGIDGRDLLTVYRDGLPFFRAGILSDLLFTVVLFSAWAAVDEIVGARSTKTVQ